LNANNSTISFICSEEECCPIERVEEICKKVSKKQEGDETQGSKLGGKYSKYDKD
jgi:hypothetical protein